MTLDDETTSAPEARPRSRRRAASRPAGPPAMETAASETAPTETAPTETAPTETTPAEKPPAQAPRKRASRKKAVPPVQPPEQGAGQTSAQALEQPSDQPSGPGEPAVQDGAAEATEASTTPRRRRARMSAEPAPEQLPDAAAAAEASTPAGEASTPAAEPSTPAGGVPMPLFQAPEPGTARPRRRAASRPAGPPQHVAEPAPAAADDTAELVDEATDAEPGDDETPELAAAEAELETTTVDDDGEIDTEIEVDVETDAESDEDDAGAARRRRRRRGGRGRRGRAAQDAGADDSPPDGGTAEESAASEPEEDEEADESEDEEASESAGSRRRRRRRRRSPSGAAEEPSPDDPPNTVVRVRESRRSAGSAEVSGVRGSTRLEAKRMRRREGREAGRRRPLITEAEFLARRESVDRVMVVRELDGRTQIGVLEDGVLVEHYVARRTQSTMVGNVYLGRVQNVLPSMEAAFVDIGKGRNAVLYAGEVNWDAAGLEGQPKRIEHALKSGESVLVQVTKEPIGHKGARLTSQVSLPGRYLVYVPDGSMTGISRKLPDTERTRLKKVLREVVPDDAGVIVRTAAEGASEDELKRDVARLQAQWEDISRKAGAVNPPSLLYGEPDLAIRVVRDIFNEDFHRLVVSGDDVWDTLQAYIGHVAPDLVDRLERWTGDGDVFAAFRIDEQIAKALDRKVWLPSGGSLVIDRTEAMTVVDVNTGKFTGAGGNLEETVTKNNLEAAEEIVRQLRLRDIGGIIVIDFIDMVLESNRELVLRRLVESLGRDRTKHQVAEVTSLGLVQMTRKRVGQGLLEVFSETCECCGGRGIIVHDEPVERRPSGHDGTRSSGSRGSGGSNGGGSSTGGSTTGGSTTGGSTTGGSNAGGSNGAVAEASTSGAAEEPAETSAPRGRRRRSGSRVAAVADDET